MLSEPGFTLFFPFFCCLMLEISHYMSHTLNLVSTCPLWITSQPPGDVLTSIVWAAVLGHHVLACLISRQRTSPCSRVFRHCSLAWWPEAVCIGLVELGMLAHPDGDLSPVRCQWGGHRRLRFPRRFTREAMRLCWHDVWMFFVCVTTCV